jgi:hypothetical protein
MVQTLTIGFYDRILRNGSHDPTQRIGDTGRGGLGVIQPIVHPPSVFSGNDEPGILQQKQVF